MQIKITCDLIKIQLNTKLSTGIKRPCTTARSRPQYQHRFQFQCSSQQRPRRHHLFCYMQWWWLPWLWWLLWLLLSLLWLSLPRSWCLEQMWWVLVLLSQVLLLLLLLYLLLPPHSQELHPCTATHICRTGH